MTKFQIGNVVVGKVERILTKEITKRMNGAAVKVQERYGLICRLDEKNLAMLHWRYIGESRELASERLAGIRVGDEIEAEVIAPPLGGRGIHLSERAVLRDQVRTALLKRASLFKKGDIVSGTVKGVRFFGKASAGVLVTLSDGTVGLLHDSEVAGETRLERETRVLALEKNIGAELTLMVVKDGRPAGGGIRVPLSEKMAIEAQKRKKIREELAQLKVRDVDIGKVVRLEPGMLIIRLLECVEGRLPVEKLGKAVLASVARVGTKLRVMIEGIEGDIVRLTRVGL
jgi:ribosomal protein S1